MLQANRNSAVELRFTRVKGGGSIGGGVGCEVIGEVGGSRAEKIYEI